MNERPEEQIQLTHGCLLVGYHSWPVLCLLVISLEYLGMELTVDQWLITQLQKSDFWQGETGGDMGRAHEGLAAF